MYGCWFVKYYQEGSVIMQYIILSLVCVGMFIFAVGAAFLASEEKPYRYNLNLTDEHEI